MSADWPPEGVHLSRLIRQSTYAETWQARSADGRRIVAKRIDSDTSAATRIARINNAAASLRPHVVVATDVRHLPDGVVLISPYADGGSLADLLAARSRLSVGEVVTLLAPLAQALAAAHAGGLGHGAVTAGNVVFRADGMPMLTDTGVRAAVERRGVTAADDVRMLARLGVAALGPATAGAEEGRVDDLTVLLRSVADAAEPGAGLDASALAAQLMAIGVATPIALQPIGPAGGATSARQAPRRRPDAAGRRLDATGRRLRRGALAVGAVAIAATVGIRWGSATSAPAARALPLAPAPSTEPAPEPAPPAPASTDRSGWLDVMRALETTRAAAFRTADPRLLHAIYADSTAARADRTTLHRLRNDGHRVVGLRPRVRSATLLRRRGATVRLSVVDAMSSFTVVASDGAVVERQRASHPERRMFTLRRTRAGWRVAAVRSGQPRSAASAASTSS